MNREIKFRAWHEETKTMHNDVNPFRWDFVISNSWHRCEKSTGEGFLGSGGNTAEMLVPAVRYDFIMQYTGLKDKNGKSRCQGDIIKRHTGYVFEEKERLYSIGHGTQVWGYDFHPDDEIIGNIQEHPELLPKTN